MRASGVDMVGEMLHPQTTSLASGTAPARSRFSPARERATMPAASMTSRTVRSVSAVRAVRAVVPALSVLLLTTLATSCKRDDPAPTPSATASVPASAASASASVAAPRPRASAEKRAVTPEDKARFARYQRALAAGRKATVAKDNARAVAAFTDALEAMPDDPRALAERAFAELSQGKLDDADKDLARAKKNTEDPELLAPIWFNIGLVAEKRDRRDEAARAYQRSNELKATRAAADKLAAMKAPPPRCPVTASKSGNAGLVVRDWKAVRDRLAAGFEKRFSSPAALPVGDEAAVRKALLQAPFDPMSPWIAHVTDESRTGETYHIVLPTAEGSLRVIEAIAEGFPSARCGSDIESVSVIHGQLARVVIERSLVVPSMMCEKKGKEPGECTGDPGEEPIQSFCKGVGATRTELVVDPSTGVVADLVQEIPYAGHGPQKPAATVTMTGRTLRVDGGGCSITMAL